MVWDLECFGMEDVYSEIPIKELQDYLPITAIYTRSEEVISYVYYGRRYRI